MCIITSTECVLKRLSNWALVHLGRKIISPQRGYEEFEGVTIPSDWIKVEP